MAEERVQSGIKKNAKVKPQRKCMFCGTPLTKKESGTCKMCKKFSL